MSRKGQTPIFDRSRDRASHITTLTYDYPAGQIVPLHFHDRDQVVYASRGVMTIRTGAGTWVVPTHRAVWIPAAVPHTITMSGVVAMRTLYLRLGLAKKMPRACCVVNVSPLLRELILHACAFGPLKKSVPRQRHLLDLMLDQFEAVSTVPLQLPHLSDQRARRVTEMLIADVGSAAKLGELCRASGAGKRTVERLFQEEVGMTFGRWRQQLRLMHAVKLLAEGAKVTHAALEAGYSTPSAFISVFRKHLGTTPASYFRAPDRQSKTLNLIRNSKIRRA